MVMFDKVIIGWYFQNEFYFNNLLKCSMPFWVIILAISKPCSSFLLK